MLQHLHTCTGLQKIKVLVIQYKTITHWLLSSSLSIQSFPHAHKFCSCVRIRPGTSLGMRLIGPVVLVPWLALSND